jgi:flavin-dependent dehydrogenase
MFDVIVVGARCAGSPLAMLLSRKGCRVLLVDKAQFPSDTVSTHLIWQSGLAYAKRWGLLEKIAALGAPTIHTIRFLAGELEFSGSPPPLDGIDYAIGPRRTVLDKLLVDAAVDAGAELRENFYVSEVTAENGRVSGIRGRTGGGAAIVENARLIVGADGAHSVVATAVKAPKYNERPSTSPGYYAYWRGGPPAPDFEIYFKTGWGGGLFPTNDGQVCIVFAWRDSAEEQAGTPQEIYQRCLRQLPRTAEFVRSAQLVEPVTGKRDLPGFFRRSHGDGWALAGDAGYHKHPLSAQGITDAFRDADLLSEAIDAGFSGRRDLNDALEDYESQRNKAVMPMFESTCQRALFDPFPAEMTALFRALQRDQRAADQFFGTDAGTVSLPEFFAPHNLESIIRNSEAASGGNGD